MDGLISQTGFTESRIRADLSDLVSELGHELLLNFDKQNFCREFIINEIRKLTENK